MRPLTRQKVLPKPENIDPNRESIALEYLRRNRGRGPYEPATKLSNIASKIIGTPKKSSAAQIRLLKLRWTEIIGEQLAKICAPEAIRGKTLVLRANGAATPLLQMRQKEILGLAALGCGVHFSKLSFIHAPLVKKPLTQQRPRPLDAKEAEILEGKLKRVQSEGLKKALRLFNMAVQGKQNKDSV